MTRGKDDVLQNLEFLMGKKRKFLGGGGGGGGGSGDMLPRNILKVGTKICAL